MTSDKPVYILDGKGLHERDESAPAAAPPKRLLGRPLLGFSLLLALLTYYIDSGGWLRAAEKALWSKQQRAALKPFYKWAKHHPLSYDDIAISPSAYCGKPVLWDISCTEDGACHIAGAPAQKIRWTNTPADELRAAQDAGHRVLARVEDAADGALNLALLHVG
ncbi:MAG: hypothetical protein ABIJ96_09780 [Elusimicrobiota bacterium]